MKAVGKTLYKRMKKIQYTINFRKDHTHMDSEKQFSIFCDVCEGGGVCHKGTFKSNEFFINAQKLSRILIRNNFHESPCLRECEVTCPSC